MADITPEFRESIFVEQVRRLGLQQPLPDYVTLNAHQLVCNHHMARVKRLIVSMDKGLGKTLNVLTFFESPEINLGNPGFTALIFTTEKGMEAYVRDIKRFPDWEGRIQLVYGDKAERAERWRNRTARYFVCTYAGFLSDVGARAQRRDTQGNVLEMSVASVPQWVTDGVSIDAVVLDEFHRVIRRRKSAFFEVAKRLFRDTKYFIPTSGSAVSKDPSDLWAALHLVDRKLWSSYWSYVYTWCEIEEGHFGKKIVGPKRDRIDKWRQAVKPQVFHCTAEMVGSSMPELNRTFLDVNLPKWQRSLHDQLLRSFFAETEQGDFIFASNRLSALYKARIALICPKVLDPNYGYGIGIEEIVEDAQESELTRYALFTPFKDPIPHLVTYLESRGARVWVLQGGIGRDEQERRLNAWRGSLLGAAPDRPSIILSTIKYGESWEIPEASYEYFLGYEYDPEDNKQAEARARRIISPRPVTAYYVRHLGAYDEDLIDILVTKADNRMAMFKDWHGIMSLIRQPT